MQPTITDLLSRLSPSDIAVFAAGDFLDVRFRLHCHSWTDLALAAQFMSVEAPAPERGIRAVE